LGGKEASVCFGMAIVHIHSDSDLTLGL
jgi:hypothetical protein